MEQLKINNLYTVSHVAVGGFSFQELRALKKWVALGTNILSAFEFCLFSIFYLHYIYQKIE